jgi:xanthine dehydrogenase accessory factor
MSWAAHALDLISRGKPAAMVTLVHVAGSAPRDAGARMIVGADASHGTIGGGNLELQLMEQARRLMAQNAVDVLQQDYPLGPLLAQCCGGHVRVLVERLSGESRSWLAAAAAAEQAGEAYTLEGRSVEGCISRSVSPAPPGEEAGVRLYDLAGAAVDHRGQWSRVVECIVPAATPLYLLGAGHVGRAIAHIATTLPFHFRWLDSRPEFAAEDPRITVRRDLVSAVTEARPGAFFLVVTHAHELDYSLVRAVLSRDDARFCGLIGSATKRARFVSRLAREGIDTRDLVCPIGAGAIRSKAPAAIAVGVAAELLAVLEAARSCTSVEAP